MKRFREIINVGKSRKKVLDSDLESLPSTSSTFVEPDEMDNTTKITDLNDDCLMEIFENLSLDDLISVSTTNKRFNEVARTVFAYKYSRYRIEVSGMCISAWDGDRNLTCKQHRKHQSDVQAFLYYFGDSITKLSIQFDDRLTPKQIERNLLRCCHISLSELKLCGIQGHEFSKLKGKFQNVEKLTLYSCRMQLKTFESFFSCFPAVNQLDLIRSTIKKRFRSSKSLIASVNKQFLNLQHLKIVDDPTSSGFDLMQGICNSHKNLKCLSFGITRFNQYHFDVGPANIFDLIQQNLTNLEHLELYNLNGARLEMPKEALTLKKLSMDGLIRVGNLLPTSFNHLEEFEMKTPELNNDWIRFISGLTTLKKLSIRIFGSRNYIWRSVDDEQFLKLSDLPNLEEMLFAQAGTSIDLRAVRRFILNCKTLKRLTMIYYSWNRVKRNEFLQADFGAMWKVREDFLAIVIEKCD